MIAQVNLIQKLEKSIDDRTFFKVNVIKKSIYWFGTFIQKALLAKKHTLQKVPKAPKA